ncbi:MAG: hypothetical protein EOR05_32320 [Mesorhizobium sp.]|nr:MAG: hypothetical protein EOR05_32320 [Mesorhizobium sp.]
MNSDGLLDVTELASYIDTNVPDLSFKAFQMRQVPQMKIVGSNFPVVSNVQVMLAGEESISAKPTHVVIQAITVRLKAEQTAERVTELAQGSQVTLVSSAAGWTLIAREGKRLGYVPEASLVQLQ